MVKVSAPLFVVSCGAVNSAALLLRSATARHPTGLANSSGLVGRRYMAHLATMMQGFHPFRLNATVFQKTVAINDFYWRGPGYDFPLGHIQSQGRTHGVMAQIVVPWIPLWAYEAWVARGVDWLAMSEDLPDDDNRVTVAPDGRVRLAYRPNNVAAHDRLVRELKRTLRDLGFWVVVAHSHRNKNTTHQCGTLVLRRRPTHVGPRSLLPRARHPESVRRRCLVLPFVSGSEPGADDRRAGTARRGAHPPDGAPHMTRARPDFPCSARAQAASRRA